MIRRSRPLRVSLLAALCALPLAAAAQKWVSPPPTQATPPSSSQAQPGPKVQATGDYLSRMDRDGDGKVSLGEYQDWLSYAFDGMDRDRDGVLTPQEQPGGRGRPLTREAHRARLAERFRIQDVDRDGALDARELAAPPRAK